jgi:hypothetical protein
VPLDDLIIGMLNFARLWIARLILETDALRLDV